jgi:proton-translocating NADH-quinone oxidoreductase chain M
MLTRKIDYNYILLVIFLIFFIIFNILWVFFDPLFGGFQFVLLIKGPFDISIRMGIDAISFFFMYLTSLLIPLCLLFSSIARNTSDSKINNNTLIFFIGILLLIVFYVLDFLLFYISFEAILVPFFVYIGISGYRERRIHAAYLFFFYTLVGSFFTLISIFFFYIQIGSTDIEILWNTEYIGNRGYLLWMALFITFAIKVPMFPFHIRLPEAHVEAPTEGSVLLAGLLLKLGTYGFLRFLFPLLPNYNLYFSPFVVTLASIGIIYTSFSTLRQIDIKRVIAYSSIAHMNMCMVGLFSYNLVAFIGSIFLMIAHGVVSGGLFFVIGMIYNRYRTKIIHYFSGLIHFMPVLSFFFFMLMLGNIGMPGTSNFIGELLILCGVMYHGNNIAIIGSIIGIFLCTVYSMWMYNKVTFLLPKFYYVVIPDLFMFEIIILLPLVLLMLFLGVLPTYLLNILDYNTHYHFLEIFN